MGYIYGSTIVEFTICADNCTVQDKNNITIWYILWIVKTGVFSCVMLLGFIRGRTNNSVDSLFNILEGGYHKRDIFTYEELLKILDENTWVYVTKMNPEDFMD